METAKQCLFATPLQLVLDQLLQHTDLEMSDAQLTDAITGAKRASIHQALLRLTALGIVRRQYRHRRCVNRVEQSLPWIAPLKIVSNILNLDPFVATIRKVASKIILFGSRASGTNRHDSDYDVLVITMSPATVARASRRVAHAAHLQLLIKTPEEFLGFDAAEPTLTANIRKGIVLWEQ